MKSIRSDLEPESRILQPGRNCWRVEHAGRVAFLIDGAAYFAAFRAAAARARRSIFIIGWDIDSRVALLPGQPPDDLPVTLGQFLNELTRNRSGLNIYVLTWDFAMLYALDREILPIYKLGWSTHRRVHFHLDAEHPVGASHHQKIVVVDDAVAFVGGLDLTKCRWDTPEHRADDPRRCNHQGVPYPPFHDIQMLVDGDAARALGELARLRWQRGTGNRLSMHHHGNNDPWPAEIAPDLTDVEVAIARTEPRYKSYPEVQEIKQLYLDAIAMARDWIYFENQYFTVLGISEALSQRLKEPGGPEVVLVSRLRGGGWLEENTMGILRARLLKRLRAADPHQRLRVYYPDRDGLESGGITIHSKLMIVDNRLLRIGSANLNNRSMGYDTECDLAIEATDDRTAQAIATLHGRLLAEHLGTDLEKVKATIQRQQSLVSTIEALPVTDKTLRPLEPEVPPDTDEWIPDAEFIDPECPIDPDRLARDFVPEEEGHRAGRRIISATLFLLIIAMLAAAWRWTVLHDWLDIGVLIHAARQFQQSALAPFWTLALYAFGSLVALPITILIIVTAFVFGPFAGFAYAFIGSLLGATLTFWLGHILGRTTVRRLAGSRLNKLSRRLTKRSLLSVLAVRVIPVAPFTVVNLVAGASGIRFRDFLIGTAVGMTPGIGTVSFFSDQLIAVLRTPSLSTLAILGSVTLAIAGGAIAFHYWLTRRRGKNDATARTGRP